MVDNLIGEAEADDTFQARRAKVFVKLRLEYVCQRVAEGAEEVQARLKLRPWIIRCCSAGDLRCTVQR